MDPLGLYLHVPFCQAICSYCNFNRGLLDADLKRRYVEALEWEIRSGPGPKAPGHRTKDDPGPWARGLRPAADTIFFGGGTPSLLDAAEVGRLIRACRESFSLTPDAEITLETNPETVTDERLQAFREAGVNRLSFGVQSFRDAELRQLGRIHSAERAKAAVRSAQAAGFLDVSFDLMFWLPGQSMTSWLATIEDAVALAPDHLSLYLLELYPNAPLKEALERGPSTLPQGQGRPERSRGTTGSGQVSAQAADDEAADMYLAALGRLDDAGYAQYEISNVARPGHFSRHNVKYWQGGSWVGFGCGAHSTVDGHRWRNVAGTGEYIHQIAEHVSPAIDEQILSPRQRLEERLFTGLRLSEGVSRRELSDQFGLDPWVEYETRLVPFVEGGWIWVDRDRFGLTRPGMLVANEIMTTFV